MPEMAEHEAAYQEMMDTETEAITAVLAELESHGVDSDVRDDIRIKLETPGTVQIHEPNFTIVRRADHGFEVRWLENKRAA